MTNIKKCETCYLSDGKDFVKGYCKFEDEIRKQRGNKCKKLSTKSNDYIRLRVWLLLQE